VYWHIALKTPQYAINETIANPGPQNETRHNAARFARTTPATRYDEVRRRDDDDDDDDARVPLSGDSIGFNAR